jgi:hypothetical protein
MRSRDFWRTIAVPAEPERRPPRAGEKRGITSPSGPPRLHLTPRSTVVRIVVRTFGYGRLLWAPIDTPARVEALVAAVEHAIRHSGGQVREWPTVSRWACVARAVLSSS